MWHRRRKLVTHAISLWVLVVLAATVFAFVVGYLATLSRLENGGTGVFRRSVGSQRLPTLVGTVTQVEADGVLRVASKQAFTEIRLASDTEVTTVGGGAVDPSTIGVGAVVTATGLDLGDGVMLARAVVMLKASGGAALQATSLWPERLEDGAAELEAWAAEPLLGWFQPQTDDAAFAVKTYDAAAKAASIEIYGLDGKIAERLELDLPGLVRLKRGNPFLSPEEAAEALSAKSYAFSLAKIATKPPERARLEILAPNVGAAGHLGMVIRTPSGQEIEAIEPSDLAFRSRVEDPGLVRAWWAFSPDARFIAAVYAYKAEDGTFPRSIHLIDLQELGL
jgi:hypothetical protein